MRKKQKRSGDRHGLQAVTLCISTALVLILLGLVVFSVLTARNLSAYVKQNIVVTMVLQDDMSSSEAQMFCSRLRKQPYINHLEYISKEQALKDGIKALGTDPREFTDINPFLSSVEITLKADYANNDSLMHITRELKSYPNVGEVKYQRDLVDKVNANIAKISIVLLALAVLLTVVSFSLINNTVKLGIYARRFSIHTMKLVGASRGLIRLPFLRMAVGLGLLSAVMALIVLGAGMLALYNYEPEMLTIINGEVMAFTALVVLAVGIILTTICSWLSVNKFLRMKAGDLYKI